MENKYLPIGSVCTLKGRNKKIMITGYYSVEFNGNLKIKDYSGCTYPEGLLLPDQTITFNHTDIESIDFVGFKNEEQKIFSSLLDRLTGNNKSDEEIASDFHKKNDMFLTSNSTFSKLLFDENGVVMIAESVQSDNKPKKENTLKNIKFDENGYVISTDNSSNVSNPFHVEYNNIPSNDTPKTNSIFNKIEFDENGVVVSDNTNIEEKKNELLNEIKFDENGVVISVGKEQLENEISSKKYIFDENGVLLSIDEANKNQDISVNTKLPEYNQSEDERLNNYKFDENGTVISAPQTNQASSVKPNYKFDENGTVISE